MNNNLIKLIKFHENVADYQLLADKGDYTVSYVGNVDLSSGKNDAFRDYIKELYIMFYNEELSDDVIRECIESLHSQE